MILIGVTIFLLASTGVNYLIGTASIYHNKFENRRTASGEVFKQDRLTCASNNFPLGSNLRVTNIKTGCEVEVRCNDRMAISSQLKGRLVDLSSLAAAQIGLYKGLTQIKVEKINI